MDNSSLLGRIASGFVVRACAAGAALYAGAYVWDYVADVFAGVAHVLP